MLKIILFHPKYAEINYSYSKTELARERGRKTNESAASTIGTVNRLTEIKFIKNFNMCFSRKWPLQKQTRVVQDDNF